MKPDRGAAERRQDHASREHARQPTSIGPHGLGIPVARKPTTKTDYFSTDRGSSS